MRIELDPRRVELTEGMPFTVAVRVHNTGTLIGGYHVRVLGADPSWVRLSAENLSLFPDTSDTVTATVTVPKGMGAGARRIAIQVKELTPPGAISVAEIELVVPPRDAVTLALSPMTVICGHTGRYGVVLENTGNTELEVGPVGTDPEAKVSFRFDPPVVTLAPGERAIADLRTSARRRWFGSPLVRTFELGLPDPAVAAAAEAEAEAGTVPAKLVPAEPLATGTMVQKPRLSRGVLSLISLLTAVTVFAVVITAALAKLAGASAADRDLALQVAAARQDTAPAGSASMGGAVKLLAGGAPAAGVAVEIFSATALGSPLTSTATDAKGNWVVPGLADGTYKLRFRGAGFAEVWYPQALTGTDAEPVTLGPGQKLSDLKVTLGGLPATVAGQVLGDDVAGAVLTVSVPVQDLPRGGAPPTPAPTGTSVITGAPVTATSSPPPVTTSTLTTGTAASSAAGADAAAADGAVVKTVPISSDGTFQVEGLPSPGVYQISVAKAGFATATQRIDLTAGEKRTGIQLRLRTGDGVIAGSVTGPAGPLGGVVVTATTGRTVVKTVSLTQGTVGGFTLRGLVTPGTYTVNVSKDGFASQSSTITLAAGQKLTDLRFALSASAGSLHGTVTLLAGGAPAPGVTVHVTGGSQDLTTVTQSAGQIGTWSMGGLPVPGAYTVTFSRDDLQSQTVAVSMDASGALTTGQTEVSVQMARSTATVSGLITQRTTGGGSAPVGEATVTLTAGDQTYTVTSASLPAANVGRYEIAGVAPGTYTLSVSRRGTAPTSVIITVTAGQDLRYDPVLVPSASISGTVTDTGGGSTAGLQVLLYLTTDYPAQAYRTATVDAQGKYTFTDVDAPQAYVVEVRSPTAGPLTSTTLVLSASAAQVTNLTVGTTATTTSISTTKTTGTTGTTGTTTSAGTTTGDPATTTGGGG